MVHHDSYLASSSSPFLIYSVLPLERSAYAIAIGPQSPSHFHQRFHGVSPHLIISIGNVDPVGTIPGSQTLVRVSPSMLSVLSCRVA